jgi:hypothetical protein
MCRERYQYILRKGSWEGPELAWTLQRQDTGVFLIPAENGNPFSIVQPWSLVKTPTDVL